MTELYRGHEIEISQDEYAENPRGFGRIISTDFANEVSQEAYRDIREQVNHGVTPLKAIKKHYPDVVWVHRLYRYSHGGDVYALHADFPWARFDVSHVGYIFITRKELARYARKNMSESLSERIYEDIAEELEIFTRWVNGEVYGFRVDLDDCYYPGYNSYDEALLGAQAVIDELLEGEE